MSVSRFHVVALASLAMLVARTAYAEDSVAVAEHLFQEARVLVERGDYAAACPKLEASQKLEPAVGTQFNLADCYEHVGRTASAHEDGPVPGRATGREDQFATCTRQARR